MNSAMPPRICRPTVEVVHQLRGPTVLPFLDAITSGELKVTQGDTEELVGLFNLFDRFNAAQNVTIPPDMDDER